MAKDNEEISKKLGLAIRQIRKRLKLSQSELADLAGVSLNYISQVERGKPKAQLDTLLSVFEVLGLELTLRPGNSRLVISRELDIK